MTKHQRKEPRKKLKPAGEKKVIDMTTFGFSVDADMGIKTDFTMHMRQDSWIAEDGLLILMGLEPRHVLLDTEVLNTRRMDVNKRLESVGYFENGARLGRTTLLDDELDELADTIGESYLAWKEGDLLDDVVRHVENAADIDDVLYRVTEQIEAYFQIWNSQAHNEANPPEYYVQWAIRKNLPIPWLSKAKDMGFFQDIEMPKAWLSMPVQKDKSPQERPLQSRERTSLLNTIGALVELIQTAKPQEDRDSEAKVITEILKNYDDKPGLSQRNLEKEFAQAKKSLRDS